jgi:hypothetical protein
LYRDFDVKISKNGQCSVSKQWKHKGDQIIETIEKDGKVVVDACKNDGHNWNAWKNVKATGGAATCEQGDAWAAKASLKEGESYKCLRTEGTDEVEGKSVPVVTFSISHTK